MKVELREITKTFGPLVANDHISLGVESGTIHGLLGENGAGKSTLMKVLSGFISADSGAILLNGRPVNYHTPLAALAHGIGMLHQDPLDFPPLSVLDNFLLGEHGFVQPRSAARRRFLDTARQFDFDLDPESAVQTLTPGERQQLEIVRLLARGAEVLILDEPTTGISQPQKVKLFATLKKLTEQGKTIIFVTHKLEDVEALCQRVTVLRRGKVVGEVARPLDAQTLVRLMFGQALPRVMRPPFQFDRPRLGLTNLCVADHRLRLDDVSLEICAGEVVGFAGLEGSGQRLVLRACGGLLKPLRGAIDLDGVRLAGRHYRDFLNNGIAYLPAGRLDEGLVQGLELREHFELARHSHDFLINWPRTRALAETKIHEYNIRGSPDSAVESLSGGNQQRTLLALLPANLKLLLLEQPTRGLDVESAQWVWTQLMARRAHGTAIIFISADLDEVLAYADNILVFSGGTLSGPVSARATTVEEIGNLIAGRRGA